MAQYVIQHDLLVQVIIQITYLDNYVTTQTTEITHKDEYPDYLSYPKENLPGYLTYNKGKIHGYLSYDKNNFII